MRYHADFAGVGQRYTLGRPLSVSRLISIPAYKGRDLSTGVGRDISGWLTCYRTSYYGTPVAHIFSEKESRVGVTSCY